MRNYILLLAIILCTFSCNNRMYETTDDLHGEWTMTSFVAFLPALPEFNEGDIIWKFDAQKNQLIVEHKYPESADFSLKAGTYAYSRNGKYVTINNHKYECQIDKEALQLDSNTDPMLSRDGPVIQFKKVK